MTTIVASLHLPHTVDFHQLPTPDRSSSPPSQSSPASNSRGFALERQASLFAVHTPPETPSVADAESVFSSTDQSGTDSYFPKAQDSNGIIHGYASVTEWGRGSIFNQPQSRAEPAPPDTILEYSKAQERAQAMSTAQRDRRPSQRSSRQSRDHSADPRWATEWTIKPAVHGNGGLVNAINVAANSGFLSAVLRVGLIGCPTDALDERKKMDIQDKLEAEYDSLVVFVSDSNLDGHYNHYCKTILWPVFHYQIPDHPKSKAYEDHSWIYYSNLNRAFANKIVKNYKRGDVIWIHDYHLLILPAMVREKLPEARIGFFLHTAFPSSEVFRCLAMRKELLMGMLGANLVAFQTREYAHHFLQTCSRILAVEATADGLQLDDHFVNVASYPMGIDPPSLNVERDQPDVLSSIQMMQAKFAGKRLIVARDQLDSIRGVRQKLLAFELFLNKYPEWRDQVATSTTENADLNTTVSEIVTRIDAVHSTLTHQPLVFLRQDIPFANYLALLSVADVLMITSLREGMNLSCHEYVVCQDGKHTNKKYGPAVLSEFTGSSSIFGGNELAVNPWDYRKCAEAIKVALEMDAAEKERRYLKMREVVMRRTAENWLTSLTTHLAEVHDEQYKSDTMTVPRLAFPQLFEKYKKASQRLFLFGYEGALTPFGSVTQTVLLSPQQVTDVLADLMADERNIVYVMSGRTLSELELIFGRNHGIGLIAENGCFLREAGTDEWITFADQERTAKWMEAVKSILQYYVERVEGSWIEERLCSLVFHYPACGANASADGDGVADRRAGDCANHINDACEQQRVRAVPTKGCVVVEPIDWDKSTAAAYIVRELTHGETVPLDFLFVAGNGRDDEVVFHWAQGPRDRGLVADVTTVSIGRRNTAAVASLPQGSRGLLSCIQKLARAAEQA